MLGRRPLVVALSVALAVHGIKLPFALDWLYPGASQGLSSEVVGHKIAIIGAGAGGSSAAWWISKAKARSGVSVQVDVYERENYIGGRSTVVYPYNDTSLDPIELGASIFVQANKNMWRATQEFNLSRYNFDDEDGAVGFWDGEQFIFTMNESKGWLGWFDSVKAVWRYGLSPLKAKRLVGTMLDTFMSLYSTDSPSWSNLTSLAGDLGWTDLIARSSAEYLDLEGISRKFSREVIEAATRVNYGQNLDEIHALEGFCSMAATGASSVKGGNFQVFQHFLARSGAHLHLNAQVLGISEKQGSWTIRTSASNEAKVYNDVIIAAPFHSTGISVETASGTFSPDTLPYIPPPQPYVHLHVTLLTTTSPQPSPEYFGLKSGAKVPDAILTTYEGVRNGGKEPEFNSLTYHGPIAPGREEYVVKIFSKQALTDEWLSNVFNGKVGWVLRKEWDAYPKLPPTTTFPPVILAPGLYYVNAFEPFISTMETETISSRNIVDLIFRDRFHNDICGNSILEPETPAGDDGNELGNDAQSVLKTEKIKEKLSKQSADGDFVLGWDC